MRILLVEDDKALAEATAQLLRTEGYVVDWVAALDDATSAVRVEPYALVLLDLGLPDGDGIEWLRARRAKALSTPVLVLTARDAVTDRVRGLDVGADDYLGKPYDPAELLARVRALVRRSAGRALPVLRVGAIELNPATHTVQHEGQSVELTSREYAVLQELMENAGRVLTRDRLERALYGWDDSLTSNAVEVHIHHLRRKLGDAAIRTVRGVGYSMPRVAQP